MRSLVYAYLSLPVIPGDDVPHGLERVRGEILVLVADEPDEAGADSPGLENELELVRGRVKR